MQYAALAILFAKYEINEIVARQYGKLHMAKSYIKYRAVYLKQKLGAELSANDKCDCSGRRKMPQLRQKKAAHSGKISKENAKSN